MNILENIAAQQALDKGHSFESIALLADQCESAWNGVQKITFPDNYRHASSLLFAAMGGSAYGARLIKSVFFDTLRVPLDLVSDYTLPAYANDSTLIIAASYSGTTEETISCVNDSFRFDPKLIGVSSGGELKEIVERNLRPVYIFSPEYNPSMQPRLGQGYMQMGQIAILQKLGYIQAEESEIKTVIALLRQNNKKYDLHTATKDNPAKQLALLFEHKIVNLIGAGHMEGSIHAIRNPFNETGKHFANYFIVPELNHHLMEGLMYPASLKDTMIFVMINSQLYPEAIQKRMQLTKNVVEQNGIETATIELTATTKLGQAMELIQLGSYVTFYLAMLHGVDPAKIPWVDYFKLQLKK